MARKAKKDYTSLQIRVKNETMKLWNKFESLTPGTGESRILKLLELAGFKREK
jgi:hypothetical protein